MALETIPHVTARYAGHVTSSQPLTAQYTGHVTSDPLQIELPRGRPPRHIALCNAPIRSGFSEPLPLAVASNEPGNAAQLAKQQHRLTLQLLEEKEKKLAVFHEKVNARLRAIKKLERKERLNDTLALQNTENILMKCVDPVRKPPLVSSPNIAIHQQQKSGAKTDGVTMVTDVSKQTAHLTKCNQYARAKLLGETPPAGNHEEEEEEEYSEESDKENTMSVPVKQLVKPVTLAIQPSLKPAIQPSLKPGPSEQNVRIHRIRESRKAYSLLGREHLKERQKQLDHKKTVEKLRVETERMRLQAEKQVNEAIKNYQATSPVTRSPPAVQERIHKSVQRNKKISSQTDRQIKRYRSKMSSMEPRPPSLCPCHEDILHTGPGLCAHNCAFYSNSKLFAQSLASLFACYT